MYFSKEYISSIEYVTVRLEYTVSGIPYDVIYISRKKWYQLSTKLKFPRAYTGGGYSATNGYYMARDTLANALGVSFDE